MTYQEFQKRYQYNPTTDRIGKGGFGVVFKAYDTHLDRYVALKMSEVADENDSTRLAREVELAAKLPTHPNIAHYEACYTFATPLGTYDFGVLQFYNDGSLDDLIKKNVLTTDEKISILKQILNGIGFLHSNRIVHRDLKPRNILIARRGEKYIPKITDFGISKEFDAANSAAFGNSMVGAGTLAYSSPEQLSERSMHRNTDLWSYGVIAYQLFTGELPFTTGSYSATSSDGRMELFRQVNSGVLPEAVNTIPEPWQGAIRRLLVVDPMVRFRGCTAVKDYIVSGKEQEVQSPASSANIEKDLQETRRYVSTDKPTNNNPAKKSFSNVSSSTTTIDDIEATRREVGGTTSLINKSQSAPLNKKIVDCVKGVQFPMILIPGGTFIMGATNVQCVDISDDEKPPHQVSLDSFYMGKTMVTQAQWEAVMGTNPSCFKGLNLPVEMVNYDDALEFCRRLSEMTGKNYTLPTEAQWEFASRCGQTIDTKFSGSDNIEDVAWYKNNSNERTHSVAEKKPNALELYDMSGNVWEWCLDRYGVYTNHNQINPTGATTGDFRVLRGGSFNHDVKHSRVSYRNFDFPSRRINSVGFRIVLIP